MMLTTVSTTEDTEFTEKNPFSTKRLAKDLHLCVLCALYGKTLLQQQMRPGKKKYPARWPGIGGGARAVDHSRMGMTTYRAALLSGSSTRALLLLSPISSSA